MNVRFIYIFFIIQLFSSAIRPQAANASDDKGKELLPGKIASEKQAYIWEDGCDFIVKKLEKDPSLYEEGEALESCKREDEGVIKFCKNPLAEKVPQYEQLEAARNHIDDRDCTKSKKFGTAQSGYPVLATAFQDDLVRGVSKFIVSRAKAEAMSWMIERLKDNLCKDQNAKSMLQVTCILASNAEPFNATPIAWGTLKAAFEVDLEHFPERAVHHILKQVNTDQNIHDVLIISVQAARLIRQGEDILAVMAGLLDRFPKSVCPVQKVQCGLHMLGWTLQLLSPPPPEADKDRNLQLFAEISVRFFYDYALELNLIENNPLANLSLPTLQELSKRLTHIQESLTRLAAKAHSAQRALQNGQSKGESIEGVVRLGTAIIDIAEICLALVPKETFGSDLEKALMTAFNAAGYLALAVDAAVEREYARVFIYIAQSAQVLGSKLPKWFTKYGPFIAEVANAKTPEDVQRALESATAPIGGGKAKRGYSRRTVALNAFLGVQLGGEIVDGSTIKAAVGAQGGLFAPVGIDVSWGLGDRHSLGVFLSVLDLGALASLRSEATTEITGGGTSMEATIETAPEIGVVQVLSPGLYFVWGVDRFAIGAGASMAPELRRIEQNGSLVTTESAFRIGGFLAIDVTLFPL